MENKKIEFRLGTIDWSWVGVGYCFLVVFHLLPSYFLLGIGKFGQHAEFLKAVWLFGGLAIVSFCIGYRSWSVTILEPAISAIVYTATLALLLGELSGRSFSLRSAGFLYLWMVAILVVATLSAWIGERVQSSRQKQTESH
jgi:hypothetical protein